MDGLIPGQSSLNNFSLFNKTTDYNFIFNSLFLT